MLVQLTDETIEMSCITAFYVAITWPTLRFCLKSIMSHGKAMSVQRALSCVGAILALSLSIVSSSYFSKMEANAYDILNVTRIQTPRDWARALAAARILHKEGALTTEAFTEMDAAYDVSIKLLREFYIP